MWPVYEWLVKHDMPITAHSGMNVDGESKFGEPERWVPILEEFKGIKLILAHMGGGDWDQAVEIADKFPQVMFDTAISISYIDAPTNLDADESADLIRSIGAERVMFGSDYPWIDPKKEIKHIKSLPISSESKELILGENARKFFDL